MAHYPTQPSAAKDNDCDWCSETAVMSAPGRKGGTYMYACNDHEHLALRVKDNKKKGE